MTMPDRTSSETNRRELTSRRDLIRAGIAGTIGLAAARSRAYGRTPLEGEILIRGGRLVNAEGVRNADLRIVGETIAEIGSGLRPGAGARVIEGHDRLVMPGGIDPHTHLEGWIPGDLENGTRAALAG